MKNAILAYLKNESGLNEAARLRDVKRTTLQSRVKILLKKKTREEVVRKMEDSGNESTEEDSAISKYGNKFTNNQIFTVDEENQLCCYIKKCSNLNYGLSYNQVQKLAYEFAIKLSKSKIPKNWITNQQAGKLHS